MFDRSDVGSETRPKLHSCQYNLREEREGTADAPRPISLPVLSCYFGGSSFRFDAAAVAATPSGKALVLRMMPRGHFSIASGAGVVLN